MAHLRSRYSSQGSRQICSNAANCASASANSPTERWVSPGDMGTLYLFPAPIAHWQLRLANPPCNDPFAVHSAQNFVHSAAATESPIAVARGLHATATNARRCHQAVNSCATFSLTARISVAPSFRSGPRPGTTEGEVAVVRKTGKTERKIAEVFGQADELFDIRHLTADHRQSKTHRNRAVLAHCPTRNPWCCVCRAVLVGTALCAAVGHVGVFGPRP